MIKKKIISLLKTIFIAGILNAQTNSKVKLKISGGFAGIFSVGYKLAPAIQATGYYSLPKAGSDAYFTIENMGQFVSKRSSVNKANVAILGIGLRTFAKTHFYFQGQLGAGFLNQNTGPNSSNVTFGLGAGYLVHKNAKYTGFDIGVKYHSLLIRGSNLNLLAITIGHQFKFK
jgi:hypothetical protein